MKPWSHFAFFRIVYHWAGWELRSAALQTSCYSHWWEVYANGYHSVWAVISEMLKWMLWGNGPQPPLCDSTPKDRAKLSPAQLSSSLCVSWVWIEQKFNVWPLFSRSLWLLNPPKTRWAGGLPTATFLLSSIDAKSCVTASAINEWPSISIGLIHMIMDYEHDCITHVCGWQHEAGKASDWWTLWYVVVTVRQAGSGDNVEGLWR